ncbi:MAG: hypothetical protein ACQCN6_11555 [Candidatus Bathyarchaeia archaeon]|jgi:hypothetical protein
MKILHVLITIAVVFLVLFEVATTVYAQTKVFTHDHGDRAHTTAEGKSVFACDATVSIETEPKGGWLPNKTYQVNWTLRLDYVNSEFLNDNYYIQLSWPALEKLTPTIPAGTIVNQTQLSTSHKTGTISAAFTPTNSSDGFYMNPEFPFAIYVNGEALPQDWASGIWYGEGGISTNVIDPNATPYSLPSSTANPEYSTLTVTVALAVAILLVVSAILVVRKRRVAKE